MSVLMLPEKGRNSGIALERELHDEPFDTEWITNIINEKGKQAAKTGVGYDEVERQIKDLQAHNKNGADGSIALQLKRFGRLNPRPVFKQVELTNRRLVGYESPNDAWQAKCAKFYAGFDEVLEDLLWQDSSFALERGFEQVVRDAMDARGYELKETMGDKVRWTVMAKHSSFLTTPSRVLIPNDFLKLGEALVSLYWDIDPVTETFESYAQRRDMVGLDEEEILANAEDGVAGVYMIVSGQSARENGLLYEQIDKAVSRLGLYEAKTDPITMTNITNLKGFYDRYSGEFSSWRKVIDVVEQTAKDFGFREINTPAVERTELYEVKSGDELLEQTYSFKDRGERRVTLTPEQTPTRARMVQDRKDLNVPIKWVDTSKRWRYENVQKGRDREFFQTDFDTFGIETPEADAEIIACAATIYRRLDVEDQVEFLINDRNLLESLLEANGIENTVEVMRVIDDKEKMDDEEFANALADRGVDADAIDNVDRLTSISGPIAETVDELREEAPDDEETIEAIERMQTLSDMLESYNVASMCKLDLSIVRGLAYYTGLVFEAFDKEGELRALFGGGRYDDLVGLFGDQEVPAVGFAFGYSTTRELLMREGKWPEEEISTDVYIATVSESVRPEAVDIAMQLREENLTVETDLADRGLSSQFNYSDNIHAEQTIVIGERDLEDEEVTVRDMETGNERQVGLDAVVDTITS